MKTQNMTPGIKSVAVWWLKFAVLWSVLALIVWGICYDLYLAWIWIGRFVDYLVTHP